MQQNFVIKLLVDRYELIGYFVKVMSYWLNLFD